MARTIKKHLSAYHNSGKDGKQRANRAFRRVSKIALHKDGEDAMFPLMREVSCVWDWRDYRCVYYDSLRALKEEWWATDSWYRWKFK